MKKISAFLASLLFVMAVMTSFGNMQEVSAFALSDVKYQDYNRYESAKKGTSLYFSCSLDYSTAESMDLTGWKAALCPENNKTLSGAVVVYDVSNANKFINHEYSYARVSVSGELMSDIPEGYYKQVFFDANGNIVYEDYSSYPYVNKTLVSFSCITMNNDGYAYAYVYSESPAVNASTYPTFYAADKKTAVTSFNDYTTGKSEYGDTIHYYKLNILDDSKFVFDQEDGFVKHTWLYYTVGTPIVALPQTTVSGNDVSGNNPGKDVYNDGGVAPWICDANGFHYTNIFNLNEYVDKVKDLNPEYNWAVVNPFEKTTSKNNSSNKVQISDKTAVADVDGKQLAVSVTELLKSEDPNVQASTDKLANWVGQGSTKDVVKVLNQYAPTMKVSSVKASGTLELLIGGAVDFSAGIPVTFTNSSIAANVKSGDKIIVLHVKKDGSIEYIPAVAGDGKITGTFTSLSPVAWFKVDASGTADGVSPKTGESFWDFLLALFR